MKSMRCVVFIISLILIGFVAPVEYFSQQILFQHNWDDGTLACGRPQSYCDCHAKSCHDCLTEKMTVVPSPGGKPGKSFRSKLWNCDERAEIGWEHVPWRGRSGEERWYAYSIYFENDNFAGGGAQFITQFGSNTGNCGGIGGHIKVRGGGVIEFETNTGRCTTKEIGVAKPRQWHRLVIHTNWSTSNDGYLEVYWDGVKTWDVKNSPVNFKGSGSAPYLKIGIYNGDPWKGQEPVAAYYDDFVLYGPGTKLCDVIPDAQGCGGRPTPSPSPTKNVTLNLQAGWNLISVPVEPGTKSIGTVLSGIEGKYEAVYTYNSGSKQYEAYVPGASGNALTSIEAGRGYWIFMNEGASLKVNGSEVSKSLQLRSGWNLIGYNSLTPRSVTDALNSISSNFIALYAFDGVSKEYKGYLSEDGGDLKTFEPGLAYWIYVTDDVTWNLV